LTFWPKIKLTPVFFNELSNEIKESIKVLQIAETQLKMHQDTLKLLSISRNSLVNQLREKLKKLE